MQVPFPKYVQSPICWTDFSSGSGNSCLARLCASCAGWNCCSRGFAARNWEILLTGYCLGIQKPCSGCYLAQNGLVPSWHWHLCWCSPTIFPWPAEAFALDSVFRHAGPLRLPLGDPRLPLFQLLAVPGPKSNYSIACAAYLFRLRARYCVSGSIAVRFQDYAAAPPRLICRFGDPPVVAAAPSGFYRG